MIKKNGVWVFAEVALVLSFWILLRNFLRSSGFSDWQVPIFGAALLTSTLLLFVLPVLATLSVKANAFSTICNFNNWKRDFRIGGKAAAYILPATVLFPIVGLVGSEQEEWLGALILTAGFLVAGWFYVARSKGIADTGPAPENNKDLSVCIALLLAGLLICLLVSPFAPPLARVIRVLLFVGFLEEFFFRGYIQSRLNGYFGKSFRLKGVDFGYGLILTAVIFGLFHPVTVMDGTPWPWALWTGALGLALGFIREKTGSVVSSAVLHGIIILPTVFIVPG